MYPTYLKWHTRLRFYLEWNGPPSFVLAKTTEPRTTANVLNITIWNICILFNVVSKKIEKGGE